MHACFALFKRKTSPNLRKFSRQIEKANAHEDKIGQYWT